MCRQRRGGQPQQGGTTCELVAVLGVGPVSHITKTVLFRERDVERVSGVSIKQKGSTDRRVAGRILLLYNFNDSVVAF